MTTEPRPLIIIGAARSGTKFLRDTLASSRVVSAVPYDITYVWRYGNESWADDALPVSRCDERARQYIREFVLGFGDNDSEIVVEKTVANSLRVPYVFEVFPEARFVHLVRDGRDVVESAYRQWLSPVDWRYTLRKARQFPLRNFRYALWYSKNLLARSRNKAGSRVWGPRYPHIESDVGKLDLIEVCAMQWVACIDNATRDLRKLPADSVFTVQFEDLISDQSVWVELCKFAGIDDIDAVVGEMETSVRPDTIGRWKRGLDAELADRMMPVIARSLREHGYINQSGA